MATSTRSTNPRGIPQALFVVRGRGPVPVVPPWDA